MLIKEIKNSRIQSEAIAEAICDTIILYMKNGHEDWPISMDRIMNKSLYTAFSWFNSNRGGIFWSNLEIDSTE